MFMGAALPDKQPSKILSVEGVGPVGLQLAGKTCRRGCAPMRTSVGGLVRGPGVQSRRRLAGRDARRAPSFTDWWWWGSTGAGSRVEDEPLGGAFPSGGRPPTAGPIGVYGRCSVDPSGWLRNDELVKVTIEVTRREAQRLVAALEQAWYDAELHAGLSERGDALVVVRHVRDLAVLRAVATEHAGKVLRFRSEED